MTCSVMGKEPKITVCLPTYNRAEYLLQCMNSILNQTVSDFELIVSDNCSADSTGELVRACGDSRVRYYRNERNVGPYRNMNRCLELARGEYVTILHDDDLYAPTFLEKESVILDRNPSVGMVHCAVYLMDGKGNPLRVVRAYPRTCIRDGKREFVRFLQGHNVCCSTVMVRRQLYEAVGSFEPQYLCSDYLMWLRLALSGDIAYVAEPLVGMRVHAETVTSHMEPDRWYWEFMAIVEKGFALAETTCPWVIDSRDRVMRAAVRAQGRRFFVAAMAAAAEGSFPLARGYVEVLRKFQASGLPRAYATVAGVFLNPVARQLLLMVRRLRGAWAARDLPVLEAR